MKVGDLDVFAMGKRGSRSQSQLLNTLTKKQKKHLRDFGEEHPFYDRYGGALPGPAVSVAFPGLGPLVSLGIGTERRPPLPTASRASPAAWEDFGGIPPGMGFFVGLPAFC